MSVTPRFDRPGPDAPTGQPEGDAKLFISRVSDSGPAASAGLTEGTRILTIDGESVETLGANIAALRLDPERLEFGQRIRLEVEGPDGTSRTVEVTAGKDAV